MTSKALPTCGSAMRTARAVLSYRTGIRGGRTTKFHPLNSPFWLEGKGKDRWWNVDGDPILTGRLTFPCPAAHLATELKKINRPLLVQAKKDDTGGEGTDDRLLRTGKRRRPARGTTFIPQVSHRFRANDRILYLCWKNSPHEWLLEEDSEATEQMQVEEKAHVRDPARVKGE